MIHRTITVTEARVLAALQNPAFDISNSCDAAEFLGIPYEDASIALRRLMARRPVRNEMRLVVPDGPPYSTKPV